MSNKRYKLIYCDPPWEFSNKNTGGSMNSGANAQYNTMTVNEMRHMDIESICDDDCILVLWYVGSQPKEAIELCEAWGFTIRNMNGFVWRKLTKKRKRFFGMGFWTRAGSESAIIATRGKPTPASRSVRAVHSAIVRGHSVKPDIFRKLAVELAGDVTRLEMFARGNYRGWDVFGNECDKSIEIPTKVYS